LVRKLAIVDVTPQVNDSTRSMSRADRGAVALVAGPPVFDSFEAIAGAAVATSPHRPRSAVERGVRHNAVELPDGRWTWRYDLFGELPADQFDFAPLWDDVSAITVPIMLVRGGDSKFVTEDDMAEFRRRQPGLRLEVVAGSGHAVQSDQPLELTRLIEDFVFGTA
jgi:pimeloyl-ACP methyl ester carboxylesterase